MKRIGNKESNQTFIQRLRRLRFVELLFIIGAIWIVCQRLYGLATLPCLCRNGVTTTGYVYSQHGGNKGGRMVKYVYYVDNVAYKGRYTEGWCDSIQVCYLPSHPYIHASEDCVRRASKFFNR